MGRVPVSLTGYIEFVIQKAVIGYFDENLDIVGVAGFRPSFFDLPLIGGLGRAVRYLRLPGQPAVLFGLTAFPRGIDNDVQIALVLFITDTSYHLYCHPSLSTAVN
jgi:hypothetical protein